MPSYNFFFFNSLALLEASANNVAMPSLVPHSVALAEAPQGGNRGGSLVAVTVAVTVCLGFVAIAPCGSDTAGGIGDTSW